MHKGVISINVSWKQTRPGHFYEYKKECLYYKLRVTLGSAIVKK